MSGMSGYTLNAGVALALVRGGRPTGPAGT
jgi:hypothetical protein